MQNEDELFEKLKSGNETDVYIITNIENAESSQSHIYLPALSQDTVPGPVMPHSDIKIRIYAKIQVPSVSGSDRAITIVETGSMPHLKGGILSEACNRHTQNLCSSGHGGPNGDKWGDHPWSFYHGCTML
jgi:hypothetical protein